MLFPSVPLFSFLLLFCFLVLSVIHFSFLLVFLPSFNIFSFLLFYCCITFISFSFHFYFLFLSCPMSHFFLIFPLLCHVYLTHALPISRKSLSFLPFLAFHFTPVFSFHLLPISHLCPHLAFLSSPDL